MGTQPQPHNCSLQGGSKVHMSAAGTVLFCSPRSRGTLTLDWVFCHCKNIKLYWLARICLEKACRCCPVSLNFHLLLREFVLIGAGLSLFGLLDSDTLSLLSSVKNSVCPHRLVNLLPSLFSRRPIPFPTTCPTFIYTSKYMLYAHKPIIYTHLYIYK